MIRRARVGAMLAAVVVLVLPAVASAGVLSMPAAVPPQFRALLQGRLQASPKPRQGFVSRLELRAQHGYEISVVGEGDVVAIEVTRSSHGKEDPFEKLFGPDRVATVYVAKGTVTPHRIAASFGAFGEVDVRFRPSGRVLESKPRRRCRGTDHFSSQLGVFVGHVRFNGEKHYVEVRSQRAKGRIRTPLRLHCNSFLFRPSSSSRARPVRQQSSFTPNFFTASWRHAVSAAGLFVFHGRKATLFAGFSEKSLGSMARVSYGLVAATSKKAFVVNDALTSATIAPPAPFHGKGIYRAAPDGTTTWTGPLSLAVPGAPRLPLAGDGFKAAFE